MRYLLLILLTLGGAAPAFAAQVYYGVDFEKVDWPTFCPSVKPIPAYNCDVTHPASGIHQTLRLRSGERELPKTREYRCDSVADDYALWTSCDRDGCNRCREKWKNALLQRETFPQWFSPDQQIDVFHARYFPNATVQGVT